MSHLPRILITCGPTWVKIDDVRVLSNISSGELGHLLAEELSRKTAVTLAEGAVTHALENKKVKKIKFRFFDELEKILKNEIKKHGVIIHAAAVSDFQLKKSFKNKISSSSKKLNLELVPTVKLINQFKKWNPNIFLVGFKLEPDLTEKNIKAKTQKLFQEAHCDLVVANRLKNYQAFVVNKSGDILKKVQNKNDLAEFLTYYLSLTSYH